MADSANPGFLQRNYFLLRRLHSLSGIVPVGVFLCVHLTINATILAGSDGGAFQTAVDGLHLLEKVGLLTIVEVVGIFLPLLFHAVLGAMILLSGRWNVNAHSYGGNVRYTLQRISGIVAVVFIVYHLWDLHWLGKPFGGADFDPHHAAATAAAALSAWYQGPIYVLGVAASVYHLANGIWTFLITWGITIGAEGQRKIGWVCAAFGVVLGLAGFGALRGFKNFEQPKQFEQSALVNTAVASDHTS